MLATESSLELADRQRRRVVWRFDGGAGSDEQVSWLLSRGYQLVGKGLSNRRAEALARQVKRWDQYQDCWLGTVPPPFDYGRPVQVFVKKRLKKGKFLHSYYLTTLKLPAKGTFMTTEVALRLNSFAATKVVCTWLLDRKVVFSPNRASSC